MSPRGAWPCAAGVMGRRAEGTELPGDQQVGGSTGSYTLGFWPHCLVVIMIKTLHAMLCTS